MSLVKEFQDFIARGNVIDMAVGVIIGAAFGKITTSLVNDIITPPIGLVLGNAPFKSLALTLKPEEVLANGTVIPAVSITYGIFIQSIIDFLIISACVFLLIKAVNHMNTLKKATPEASVAPAPPSEDILLLRDIRDSLCQREKELVIR